ncbi:beta-1,6-N-acetylglucosaminyltransferase [Chitinophaga pendula]|uniref:beta-1,6-N-acetylglucosaminyltransferase n=1 Tax=Chitinophaga TaxID=79328 RepID=UPI000BB09C2D|nr:MULTISPECIES: beta-1,6-N-acetylglucosaminyltransferase [Chitinophaga]ASZ13138.1 glycosyl transferase [Chitinophaga sp. MD30]UCJ09237.1 beta-1,6-N-acetylglucosaminyltransferase [Chitinophaga pendula]
MKLAFIILAHKNPAQLQRLLLRLQHTQVDCYVHVDAKCNIDEWKEVLSLPQVYPVSERANVTWAGWGIIQATLNGMEAVMASEHRYHYITLLSAQDYLLQPIEKIYEFLCTQQHQQFMDVISEEALQPNLCKMDRYHFVEYNFPGKYMLTNILAKILPPRKAPLGLKLECGSAWWTLTQDCVAYCLEYERKHPALRRYLKLTWGADEFIFQTILLNSNRYRDQITKTNLHYIDWSAGKEHPKTFGIEDLNTLLNSGKYFARKFDMKATPELLDKIDNALSTDPVTTI